MFFFLIFFLLLQYYYFSLQVSEFECKPCPNGTWSGPAELNADGNNNRSVCHDLPESYLDYSSHWSIAAMGVAGAGMCVTLFAMIVFGLNWNTPVVKASGRELSSILLAGVCLSFLTTFVIVAKPCVEVCGIMRFAIGFCYTVGPPFKNISSEI